MSRPLWSSPRFCTHTCVTACQRGSSHMNATQSALALTCEREHTAPRMQKEKKKKNGGRLLRSQVRTCVPFRPRTWHWRFSVMHRAKVCVLSGRCWARPGPQRSLCVGVGWACGSESWPLLRPTERVRCVTCSTNEFPWPGKTTGRAY